MPRPRRRRAVRFAWLPVAFGTLAAALPSPTRADSDCFRATRELRVLQSTASELKSTLPKATAKEKPALEKRIAEIGAQVDAMQDSLEECTYTLHVHAVRVSDSCPGQRAAEIDPDQVRRWIDKANEVYRVAGVRFEFDPTPKSGDWAALASNEVNDLTGELPGDVGWERGNALGNELASHYPGKVVVLFRHGRGAGATGGGFSGTRYNYVVMPGFNATTACGVQNAFLFAHELGHYFGLDHTFLEFKTKSAAAEALRSVGNRPSEFDADRLAETPPEPYIEELACSKDTTVTLNGIPFSLLRDNVMSYYFSDTKTLVPQQIRVVRAWVERRYADAMDGLGPFVPDERRTYLLLSAENAKSLSVAEASKENGAKIVQADWNGGAHQYWKIVPLTAQDTGFFEIVSVATGKCLTVDTGDDGAALMQWDWEGKRNQKWRFTQDATGDLAIESRQPRRVLAVSGASKDAAVNLVEPDAPGGSKLRWRLVPQD